MSQHSEDRVDQAATEGSGATPAGRGSAQVIPFERPQSSLQRAIQQRAQEALDVERDREREARKPAPLRWLLISMIAAIPIVLILFAVDGFLRVIHRVNEVIYSTPPPAATEQAQPARPVAEPTPGVIMLQPIEEPPAAPREDPSKPSDR